MRMAVPVPVILAVSGGSQIGGSRLSTRSRPGARRLCGGVVTVYHSAMGPHQWPAHCRDVAPAARGRGAGPPHAIPKIAPVSRPIHAPSRSSLYRSGLAARLAAAAGMAVLVWLAIAWALAL